MKRIGLIGGMSWESTTTYYQMINRGVRRELSGLHSADVMLHSLDFARIATLQQQGDWVALASILTDSARLLEQAGAECIVICTNTMHKLADDISGAISIPLLHIADATALQLQKDGIPRVGLLGTRFTMEQAFYKDRLTQQFGIGVVTPDQQQRDEVHRVIYDELCQGDIRPASRDFFLSVIHDLKDQGAEAVILGCTELGLLLDSDCSALPLYDTARLHAKAAVDFAVS